MLCIVTGGLRVEARNTHLPICNFTVEQGAIGTHFDLPQRCAVCFCRQKTSFSIRGEWHVLFHAREFRWPASKRDLWIFVVVAVRATNVDGLPLMLRIAGVSHQADAGMTVDATHAREVVCIGRHTLNRATVGQSQCRRVSFRQACVTQ